MKSHHWIILTVAGVIALWLGIWFWNNPHPDDASDTRMRPVSTASGTVHSWAVTSDYVDSRRVDVWLPDGYTTGTKYTVLYMHDGNMLFDSTITWNKQEWMVDETMSRLQKSGQIPPTIVVGIWNNGKKRAAEYFPQKAAGYVPESRQAALRARIPVDYLADNYLKFMVEELIPMIEARYSVGTTAAYRFVAGSSMGGLISMYALLEYPELFSGAACLSTHWPGIFEANDEIPAAIRSYMNDRLPAPDSHRIWFDHGTETLDALYGPYQVLVDELMEKKGFDSRNWITRVYAGTDHSERAWASRFEDPVLFLLGTSASEEP